MKRGVLGLAAGLIVAVTLVACAEEQPSVGGGGGGGGCNPPPLKNAGTLTVAAEYPYYAPFLVGKQANPTGYEGQMIYDIANKLGANNVKWVNIAFDQLYAPGPKQWDVGVSEITITKERDQAVDFSAPYFDANQGILVRADSKYAGATTTQQLLDAKFGAEAGTTGLDYVKERVKPKQPVSEFDTTDVAAQALKSGTIDIQVIDVPIAVGIIQGSKDVKLKLIGEFITHEQYGLAMEEGSRLKPCVDQAIEALKSSGELKKLQLKYFPGSTPLRDFQPVA